MQTDSMSMTERPGKQLQFINIQQLIKKYTVVFISHSPNTRYIRSLSKKFISHCSIFGLCMSFFEDESIHLLKLTKMTSQWSKLLSFRHCWSCLFQFSLHSTEISWGNRKLLLWKWLSSTNHARIKVRTVKFLFLFVDIQQPVWISIYLFEKLNYIHCKTSSVRNMTPQGSRFQ